MIKKLTLLAAGVLAGIFLSPVSAQTPCFQVSCLPAQQSICDVTDNDLALWHHIDWWDPATQSNNLADVEVDLSLQVEELCAEPYTLAFELLLDLDNNGVFESRITPAMLADIPPGYVPYNNYPDPDQLEYRLFDFRNVAPEENYRFALQTTLSGNKRSYRIAWNTEQTPDQYLPLQLPYGLYRMRWSVSDDAGNLEICTTFLDIKDCKKPTVICLNGLTVNIMPSQMIVLFASDFLQYTTDNYTPSNKIEIGLRKAGAGTGFPLDPNGDPATRIVFDCDERGTNIVELWARDAAGNTDYCETYVIVQDNQGYCSVIFSKDSLTACLSYCGQPFQMAPDLYLQGSHPSLPPTSMFPIPASNSAGCRTYSLKSIPFLGNYTVTLSKDNDPLNGLSTYDLIKIEQYLLGQVTLDSPYKLIAADANNSRSISTVDIQELRRLILGVYSELPNNTSWRFIPSDYVFPNPLNPFTAILPEPVQLQSVDDTVHFESIKVGDVTCSATPTGQLPQRDILNPGKKFCLRVGTKTFGAGASLVVPVTAGSSGALLGYQFDLKIAAPLQLEGLIPGPGQTTDNFGVFSAENRLSGSWSTGSPVQVQIGDTLFFIKLRAAGWATLETSLSLKQNRIFAEAYTAQGEYQPLALCFSDTKLPGDPGSELLLIIQPNPVAERAWTIIPEGLSGALHWEVLDISGRLLLQGLEQTEAGQSVDLPLQTLPVGVYLYRVWMGDVLRTGKLVKL